MNVDRYKKDLNLLVKLGDRLHHAMQNECSPKEFAQAVREAYGDKSEEFIQSLPRFDSEYQTWYSEAKVLVRQLMPDRLSDFTRYYEKPRSRKEITFVNYTIEDYLEGLQVRLPGKMIAGPDAAVPKFYQQLSIVKSIRERFKSSLFDIRQLAQAELFDSELDAAKELAKNKFRRAAGSVAGVVLERHLKEVCSNHGLTIRKKNPQISDLNDALKNAYAVEIQEWRFIQHLGDIRNLCAHDKETEPTVEQVNNLLSGVARVTKTVF